MRRGLMLAILAAVAFGATVPLLQVAGAGLGPCTTAALLYAGAASMALPWAVRRRAGALHRADLPWLIVVVLAGAVLAPALLAWALTRTSSLTASLLLNAEAACSALFAWLFFREHIGRRVALAIVVMLAAGLVLVLAGSRGTLAVSSGAVAVLGASCLWGLDNAATRRLADRPWALVVLVKGGAGALLSGLLAVARQEAMPAWAAVLAVVLLGATGYGLSLRLYLGAQRRLGAARTASIFAIGPFVGAALAPLVGAPLPGPLGWLAGGLFVLGVWLHLSERHAHAHRHQPVEHDHLHRHDDQHHDHAHDPPVVGEHAHRHGHEARQHAHEHAPDLHHGHGHD
jgi:drug/metabolite transporter (DMT)-like permease